MRLVALFLAVVTVIACSDPEVASSTDVSVPVNTPTLAPTTTHPITPGTIPPFVDVEVNLAEGPHGAQLVDPDGRSLYMFALDDERTSTCEGACAGAWRPFLGSGVAGAGVDPGLLGNAERSNGSIQVTYGGHPLYLYSGDGTLGDTNGHGFNDVWFLVAPDGDPVG